MEIGPGRIIESAGKTKIERLKRGAALYVKE
jgi:hypothetical protein